MSKTCAAADLKQEISRICENESDKKATFGNFGPFMDLTLIF